MKYRTQREQKQKNHYFQFEMVLAAGALFLSTKYFHIKPYALAAGGIAVLFVLMFVVRNFLSVWKRWRQKQLYLKSDIRKIDHMSGEEFEAYLKAHFEQKGFKVKTTPTTNDYGADLILSKGGECIAVQAKRYRDKVGNKAIQEIVGALGFYHANKGMVITNSFFTANAKALAESNGIELWDRNILIETFHPPTP